MPVTGRIGVIVYLTVGDGAPDFGSVRTQDRDAQRPADTGPACPQFRKRPRAHERVSDRDRRERNYV